jgi:hypothetical protein
MKVVVIGKRNIVVAFIYHYGKSIKQDCPPIARFIDYFPYFGDGSLNMEIVTRLVQNSYHIYRVEKAEI